MADKMATGGGKWTIPSTKVGAPAASKPKSGVSSGVAAANKHANTMPHKFSIASGLSTKNKHHGN